MRDNQVTMVLLAIFIFAVVNCQLGNSVNRGSIRVSRCPSHGHVDGSNLNATAAAMSCMTDHDCVVGGDVCCPDKCDSQRKLCVKPMLTACEHQQLSREKRVRALMSETANKWSSDVRPQPCTADGRFEPVQCDANHQCWCVDESGFEIGGTRVKSRDDINCSAPRPCAGHLCRMLCPFEFELDSDGCPMCRCRDPCRGVRCPRGTQCQLEEVTCNQQPCPPVPTCKQPRSLDDVCPVGKALTVSDTEKVFLCGKDSTKPQCPMYFTCEIKHAMDYGVCCPSTEYLTKPGTCPKASKNCTKLTNCNNDMECEGLQKCCEFDGCGQVCVPMAENTRCLQQKILSELLSVREKSGQGYIPQCTANGNFVAKQCSRNGLVCWCVDINGLKLPRSMGSADQVNCPQHELMESKDCQYVICDSQCQYGFKEDEDGCPNCQCVNPCDNIKCPFEMECAMVFNELCNDYDTQCEADTYPICKPSPILYSKPGNCPIPLNITKTSCTNISGMKCQHDRDCSHDLKCCQHLQCPFGQCVSPSRISQRLPTMCEYLRDFRSNILDPSKANKVALPSPSCRLDGGYDHTQCHNGQCWCVDEFGTELGGSRSNSTVKRDCEATLRSKGCDGLLCRLGCDYGFRYGEEDGCPICDCRSPCDEIRCGPGEQCQLIEVDCNGGFCPSVPQCLPVYPSTATCPIGKPLRHSLTNATRSCSSNSACPMGHYCSSTDTNTSEGVCCKKTIKPGQCPYRLSPFFGHCEGRSQCDSDHHCPGAKKCCSDGCMATCIEPEMKTGCEHRATVSEYMIKQKSIVLGHLHVPKCEDEDGSFSLIQCEISPTSGHRYCWCADENGAEIPLTRTDNVIALDCQKNKLRNCPKVIKCLNKSCEYGFKIDSTGCPTCECNNPCDNILCAKKHDECQLIQLRCVSRPCPAVPMCAPRQANPCPFGEPMKNSLRCSSLPDGLTCPSTHICVHSIFDKFPSTCCPKSRDVCFKETDYQRHQIACPTDSIKPLKWFFNLSKNKCEMITDGKCSTSINGFADRSSCEATCPPLTDCEAAREKAKHISKKNSGFGFIPKCKRDGNWELTQCLSQLGLCWCVTSSGTYVKGTAVRGLPRCAGPTWRMGRKINQEISAVSSVSACPDGSNVHLCNESICQGKICLSRPEADCRVDPCGGCNFRFYVNHEQINCEQGLTTCQKEVQNVLNSELWLKQSSVHGQSQAEAGELFDVSLMVLPPRCSSNGQYEIIQNQGELQWCVNVEGEPIHRSLTRGNVTCDAKGVILERWPRGPVCSDTSKRPMVCRYECHNLTCPSHPEAICTTDPCNSCKVTFVSPMGERVRCEDKCLQPVDNGMCRAAFSRYFFNSTSSMCQPFVYGGCLGNDNNFETNEQCEEECSHKVKVSACEEPKKIGSCRASMKRWYFDKVTQKCQQFIYGGCDGNGNNFETKRQCESVCPDVVLCPQLNLLRTTPVACVRSFICSNRTCPNYPDAYCTVQPCDCSLQFVDFDGNIVNCYNATENVTTESEITTAIMSTSTEISIPSKTKFSRCEEQRAIAMATASYFVPSCDFKGDFHSTQCDNKKLCWCVDEVGNKLDNKTFSQETQHCPVTIVESISVRLQFANKDTPSMSRLKEILIKKAIAKWLYQFVPSVTITNISVTMTYDHVTVEFSLSGDNSIEASFLLQEKVTKETEMTLNLDSGATVILKDVNSTIEHHLAGVSTFVSPNIYSGSDMSFLSTTAVIVLAVIGAVIATMAIFFLIYILMHKRRSSGYFPQSSSVSVCSEAIYGSSKTLSALSKNQLSPQLGFWTIPTESFVNYGHSHSSSRTFTSSSTCPSSIDSNKQEEEHVYEQLRYQQ
ncbi:hypothetical protein CHUAL_009577 [Chamberlinius hualienensis]